MTRTLHTVLMTNRFSPTGAEQDPKLSPKFFAPPGNGRNGRNIRITSERPGECAGCSECSECAGCMCGMYGMCRGARGMVWGEPHLRPNRTRQSVPPPHSRILAFSHSCIRVARDMNRRTLTHSVRRQFLDLSFPTHLSSSV
jgi:hypothetical protein